MEIIKKHYLKILNIFVFFTFLISCYVCMYSGSGGNLKFFDEEFFLYKYGVYDIKIFILTKAIVFLFVSFSLCLVNFELKEYSFLKKIVPLSFFTGVLLIFGSNAGTETILIFFTILFFSLMKRFLQNYDFKYAFLFALCHSFLLLIDIKTFALTVSFFIVLFLTDDVLKVINLKKIFSLKSLSGLIMGSFPLIFLAKIDFLSPLKELSGDFLIDATGYLYNLSFAKPLYSFNGPLIIAIFMPSLFLFCGLFSLAKIEVFGKEDKDKKIIELSSVEDVTYYLSLWYPFIFLMVFSFLIKERVSFLFLYPIITPLPFLMAKALDDALPFFNEEKEISTINRLSFLVCFGVIAIGVGSGFMSLKNQLKIKEIMPVVEIVKNNPDKSFASIRYAKILNYLTKLDNVKKFKINFTEKDVLKMVKEYDYYIPSEAEEDNNKCFIIIEPDLSLMLKKNTFVKSWLCEKPFFASDKIYKDKKTYVFETKDVKKI